MISGSYKINLKTPVGIQNGILTLMESNGVLNGTIKALGRENIIRNGKANGNNFEFSGSLDTGFGNINFSAKGYVDGDILKATANTMFGTFQIIGNRES